MPWAWMAMRLTAFSRGERAEPLHHPGGRQAEPAAAGDLDGDEIAFLARR